MRDQELMTQAFIWLGAGVGLSIASQLVLGIVQRALRRHDEAFADLQLRRKVLRAWLLFLWVLLVRSFLSTHRLAELPDYAPKLLTSLMIATAGYFVGRSLFVAFSVLEHRYDAGHANNLHERARLTQLQFIEKIAYASVTFLTFCLALLVFDGARRFGTSLLASAGVASLIIGFAGQRSLANLIAGMQIAFTQPLRLGDAVVVEKEWGWVEEITFTYVVIRIWDQRRLVLPITYFVEHPFENWTRTSAQILGAVTLQVSPRVSFDAVEKELFRILQGTDLWDGDKRVLQMTEANERGLTLRALMTGKDSPTTWELRCHVRRKLVEFLQANYPDSFVALDLRMREAGGAPAVESS